jgi:hypothetical protein
VNAFIATVTENISMTRWKLLLQAERQASMQAKDDFKEELAEKRMMSSSSSSKKANTAGVVSAVGISQQSQRRQEVDNQEDWVIEGQVGTVQGQAYSSGGDKRQVINAEEKHEMGGLELKLKEEMKKVKEKNDQLQQLQTTWDGIEERRKPPTVTTYDSAEAEARDPSLVIELEEEEEDGITDTFLELSPLRSTKLFLTSDGVRYAAWKFEVEDPPSLDEDPRPPSDSKSDKYRNLPKQQNIGASGVVPGLTYVTSSSLATPMTSGGSVACR